MREEPDARSQPDAVTGVAAQQGLSGTLASFPQALRAAAQRGLRPIAPLPADRVTSEPAFVFDPARAASDG